MTKRNKKPLAPGKSPVWWNRINPFWLLGVPAAITVLVSIALMYWSLPLHVHVELTTQRIGLIANVPAGTTQPILNGLKLRSVGFERFSSVAFEPEALEIADPAAYSLESDTFTPVAWHPLQLSLPKVGFDAAQGAAQARITVEKGNTQPTSNVRLDSVDIGRDARILVEERGGKNAALAITLTETHRVTLSLNSAVMLVADSCVLVGAVGPQYPGTTELTYRGSLRSSAPWIEIQASAGGLVVLPAFEARESRVDLLSDVAVSSLDFTQQGPRGERVSALTAQGAITFPDNPYLDALKTSEAEAVDLEGLQDFSILRLSWLPNTRGVALVGEGRVRRIRFRQGQIAGERHLTAFDALSHDSRLLSLFAITVWVIPTLLGARRFYKELTESKT